MEAHTLPDWNFSWKLTHQAAEAGLLVSSNCSFLHDRFPGYNSRGHRGHGGSFPTRIATTYGLQLPGPNVRAVQAPLYTHEMHLLADTIVEDINAFEHSVGEDVRHICSCHGWNDVVWSVNLVDMYVCPNTHQVSHTIQIAYCSLTLGLGKLECERIREIMESELPLQLNLRCSTHFHAVVNAIELPCLFYLNLHGINHSRSEELRKQKKLSF